MDILLAVLAGISSKLYDDLNDMNIMTSDKVNEVLKGLTWVLLTLVSINDFNFSILFYVINLGNSIVNSNEWKSPYESSLLYVYPILLILSFHTRAYLTVADTLILCILLLFINLIEPYIFTEETSDRKMYSRILGSFNIVVLLLSSLYFTISSSIVKILSAILGYAITSSVFQVLNPTANSFKNTTSLE